MCLRGIHKLVRRKDPEVPGHKGCAEMEKNMNAELKKHYLETAPYTYAGLYETYFCSLPDEPEELGNLISHQIVHRVTLREGNTNANADLRYGDMTRYPWYRARCEDDIFLTAPAIAAELFRLDPRGFVKDRLTENKMILTCRYVSVLVSAIYKAKGIPCRSRAGFAPYFRQGVSMDHWINQIWSDRENRWITIDADGFYEGMLAGTPVTQYVMKEGEFDWAAKAWLDIRRGRTKGTEFVYADCLGTCSLKAVIRYLFYDFHALMNDEISYLFQPCYVDEKFETLSEDDFCELDNLAELLLAPDENFSAMKRIWETNRKFRVMNSPLVGERDNLPLLERI